MPSVRHQGDGPAFTEVRADKAPWNARKGVALMALGYITAFGVFLIVGVTAPPIFNQNVQYRIPTSASYTQDYVLTSMEKWHQLLYFRTRMALPPAISHTIAGGSLTVDNGYAVNVWGSTQNSVYRTHACPAGCASCPDGVANELECSSLITQDAPQQKEFTCEKGQDWCGWVGLFNLDEVRYHTYYVQVEVTSSLGNGAGAAVQAWPIQFEMIYLQENWTWFQNAWYYTWVVIMLVFALLPCLGFFVRLTWLPRANWSRQQKWTSCLIIAAIFFNNPFYAAMIWSASPGFWVAVYGICLATFLAMLMIFWLDLFDDIGAGNQNRGTDAIRQRGGRGRKAVMVARIWIVGMVWLTTVILFSYVRFRQSGDPTTYTYNDFSSFTASKVVLVVAATLYLLWLVWRGIVAAGAFMRLPAPYRYLFCVTVLTAGLAMVALYFGVLLPNQYGGVGFAIFYGMFNVYIMTLGWLYAPTGSYYKGVPSSEVGMDGEEPVALAGTTNGNPSGGYKEGADGWGLGPNRSDGGAAGGRAAAGAAAAHPSWAVEDEEVAEVSVNGSAPVNGGARRPRAPYV